MIEQFDVEHSFQIGVQAFIIRDNMLLLGRRKGVFGSGSWGLPGGRLRRGESILEAAAREVREETGLISKSLCVMCLSDAESSNRFQVQVGVKVDEWEGSPSIQEPDKCDSLRFFSFLDLPEPIFVASAPLIACFVEGTTYIDHTRGSSL